MFTKQEEKQITQSIKAAEQQTSGEIRLFVEDYCLADDPVFRAAELFEALGMTKTKARNGVLLYIAPQSRQFAIWGDTAIHEKVGTDFWVAEKQLLRERLQKEAAVEGICQVIVAIGEQLKGHFPADPGDNENELPDEIIYGQ